MVKRYGTSSMECENGIYVLHKAYEALEAERDALRQRLEDAESDVARLHSDKMDLLMKYEFAGKEQA